MQLRKPFYALRGNKIGKQSLVKARTALTYCKIGDYCYIGENCSLNMVKMGNYCSIAPYVHIGGSEHPYSAPTTSLRISKELNEDKITFIGNDVWIGSQVYVRQGVTIGDGAVIGAQSLVLNDVEPYSIVVGSPAKHLKYRFGKEHIENIAKSRYWEYAPKEAQERVYSAFNKE